VEVQTVRFEAEMERNEEVVEVVVELGERQRAEVSEEHRWEEMALEVDAEAGAIGVGAGVAVAAALAWNRRVDHVKRGLAWPRGDQRESKTRSFFAIDPDNRWSSDR